MLFHKALQRSIRASLPIHRYFSVSISPCLSEALPDLPSNTRIPPVIDVCPLSSCSCAPMPENLDIDHSQTLADTVPQYNRHLIVATGQNNWTSRIEDENSGSNITRILKERMGPKGLLYNANHICEQPDRTVLMTNSSRVTKIHYPDSEPHLNHLVDVYVFPDFIVAHKVDYNNNMHLAYLSGALPLQYYSHNASSETSRESFDKYSETQKLKKLIKTEPITRPLIYICGHESRDKRCGILGPILRTEFTRALGRYRRKGSKFTQSDIHPRVDLISHMGGHKWAGNVIIYIPPGYAISGELSSLAGKGIWYGRVEPKHIEGIVQETLVGGRIIKELFRGGVHQDSEPLKI